MSFFERLKTAAAPEWRAYTEHPFTNALADGSLAEAAFRHYLVQDYLFLIEFARAYALSVYKSPKLADMREAARPATQCARCNEPISRLDRRVCRRTISRGRGENAGTPGRSCRSLRHAG